MSNSSHSVRRFPCSLVVLIVLLQMRVSFAQQTENSKPLTTIAVMDFEAREGFTTGEAQSISDIFNSHLIGSGRFLVVDRSKIKSILEEQGFQRTEACSQVDCVVEAGKILKAQKMFAGTVGKVGTIFTVHIQLIDVASAQVIYTKGYQQGGSKETLIQESVPEFVKEIVGEISANLQFNTPGKGTTPSAVKFKRKLNVAVMDFDAREGLSRGETGSMSDVFSSQLVGTNEFIVIDRTRIKSILEEQGFQQSEACQQVECLVEAGKILRVEKMFVGTIGKVGNVYTVAIQLIDIATAQIVMNRSYQHNGPVEDLAQKIIPEQAIEMAKELTGNKDLRVSVISGSGSKLWWYVGGAAVVGGGAAYYLLRSSTVTGSTNSDGGNLPVDNDLPNAPKLP
jgi:curli biogenesis system outer membrane secretion channel CsgG